MAEQNRLSAALYAYDKSVRSQGIPALANDIAMRAALAAYDAAVPSSPSAPEKGKIVAVLTGGAFKAEAARCYPGKDDDAFHRRQAFKSGARFGASFALGIPREETQQHD
jgi:hypothetical protein